MSATDVSQVAHLKTELENSVDDLNEVRDLQNSIEDVDDEEAERLRARLEALCAEHTSPEEVLKRFKASATEDAHQGASLALSWVNGAVSLPEVYTEANDYAEAKHPGDSRRAKAAQAGTVLSVVTVAVIAIIGILIYSQVSNSLPTPENQELANTSTSVTSGFADAMNLLPVVFIVLVAALVIAVVQRFRG